MSSDDVPEAQQEAGASTPHDPGRPPSGNGRLPRQTGTDDAGGAVDGEAGEAAEPDGAAGAGGGGGDGEAGPVGSGWLLGGRYRLGERLGRGGMGTVWRARDERIGREVAVKEPRIPDSLSGEQREVALARMHREARAAAGVDHPNVVGIYDVVLVGGEPWIVMELVLGQSLDSLLSEGTLSPREAASIALPVLGALTAVHEKGVLHRDVKPANVLLGSFDRVVLADFGIAQVEGEAPLTETGHFIGSLAYMAPERALGRKPGPESDLFSLGVLLYTALEGFVPFQRQTQAATLHAVIESHPADPAQAGVLRPLIVQLLSKDPASRPGVERIASVLRSVAGPPGGLPSQEERDTGTDRYARGRVRRGRALLAGVAVAVVAGAVGWLLPWPSPLFGTGAEKGGTSGDAHAGKASPASSTSREPLPDGWKLRHLASEHAVLPVPTDFTRERSSSGEQVWSATRSGLHYEIALKYAANPHHSTTQQLARLDHRQFFADPKYRDVNYTYNDLRLDKRKATEQIATYRSADDQDPGLMHRKREVYCPGEDGKAWWLTVEMTTRGLDGSSPYGDTHIMPAVLHQVRLNGS